MKPLPILLVLWSGLALLAAAPALAQTDTGRAESVPALFAGTAEERVALRFEADLADLARLATAAALVHERTGAFPATPFGLLGAPEAAQTGARTFPLSALRVEAAADSVVVRYVPLPVGPYVSDDLVVTASVRPDGPGRYAVRHEMRRQTDAGRALLYDRTDGYEVGRGFGRLCVETAAARAMIAAGAFVPDPARLAPGEFSVRLRVPEPGGEVFYEAAREQE